MEDSNAKKEINTKDTEIKNNKLNYPPFEIKSDVFDEIHPYGANQSAPLDIEKTDPEYYELINTAKKYYPEMNNHEFKTFIKRLRSEGCGYAALVNMLFMEYEFMDDLFEKDFGFPRKRKDGTLNFNMMLVDFYAATDNHNIKADCDIGLSPRLESYFNDSLNEYEDQNEEEKKESYKLINDITGYGTTFNSCRHRMYLYLHNKSLTMEYSYGYSYSDNPLYNLNYIYANVKKNKHILLSLNGGNVQNEDGSVYLYCPGHFMLVTGNAEDGRLIMSTWGKKLYVDPDEKIEKDGNKTIIDYVYYKFHFKNIFVRYKKWKRIRETRFNEFINIYY